MGLGVAFLAAACICAGQLRVHAPDMVAMIQTIIGALIAAGVVLLAGLFRETRSLRLLMLFAGLVIVGLVEVVSNVIPADFDLRPGYLLTGGGPVAALFAGICFGIAAHPRSGQVLDWRPWGRLTMAAATAAALLTELLGWLLEAPRTASHGLVVRADPSAIVAVIACGSLVMAYVGCDLLLRRPGDLSGMRAWFGAGLLLLAMLLFSRTIVGAVDSGEFTGTLVLKLVAYTAILVGLVRELVLHQRQTATTIAQLERQRLARSLHDGLCQDLAVIAAHAAGIADELGANHPVAIAAGRALNVSRGALAELAPPADSVGDALRVLAAELSMRFAISATVEASAKAEPTPADREDLLQIAREAIVNAAKHGAHRVDVALDDNSGRLMMTVRDDGRGIAPLGLRQEGFGMNSMRQRAACLGGVITAQARDGGGTEVRVLLG